MAIFDPFLGHFSHFSAIFFPFRAGGGQNPFFFHFFFPFRAGGPISVLFGSVQSNRDCNLWVGFRKVGIQKPGIPKNGQMQETLDSDVPWATTEVQPSRVLLRIGGYLIVRAECTRRNRKRQLVHKILFTMFLPLTPPPPAMKWFSDRF